MPVLIAIVDSGIDTRVADLATYTGEATGFRFDDNAIIIEDGKL